MTTKIVEHCLIDLLRPIHLLKKKDLNKPMKHFSTKIVEHCLIDLLRPIHLFKKKDLNKPMKHFSVTLCLTSKYPCKIILNSFY